MKKPVMMWFFVIFIFAAMHSEGFSQEPGKPAESRAANVQMDRKYPGPLNLSQCLEIALQNNHFRPASKFAVEIAEAQYRQALSAYWPQVGIRVSYSIMDEDPNFVFPPSTINVPPSVLTTPLGPIPIPGQTIRVPQQDVKLMDRENGIGSLKMELPLYTGGMRGAIRTQAEKGLQVAKEEARRTDLQIIYDVKRMFYGSVLSRELLKLGQEALSRMEVTLELTENLYKKGSGRVKKTDYLRNKTVVEGLRSAVAQLKANEQSAKAALLNTMGLEWDLPLELSQDELPFAPYPTDLKKLVGNAYSFNPDWAKIQAGLEAAEAKIKEAKSGHFPKIALFGNLTHIWNNYDYGIVTAQNKDSWTVGVGMELPLFSGFRTTHEIKEAQARLGRLKEQQILLKEGIALQVKHLFIQMTSSQEQKKASEAAAQASEENRDLNERAYQEELVETKDVIEAQLIESLMKAQHQKALFDHVEAQSHLDFVVGQEIVKALPKG
jgi:outer membrane protein